MSLIALEATRNEELSKVGGSMESIITRLNRGMYHI